MLNIFLTAYKSGDNTKIISMIYKYLMNRKVEGTIYIKERWDRESGIIRSNEERLRIYQTQSKTMSFYPGENFVGICWLDSSSPLIKSVMG